VNAHVRRIAEIAVALPVRDHFHYAIPEELAVCLRMGSRVRVPFGKRKVVGYCVGFPSRSSYRGPLKKIEAVLDPGEPLADARLLELARWVARSCCAGLGETLDNMIPAGVRHDRRPKTVPLLELAVSEDVACAFVVANTGRRRARAADALSVLLESGEPLPAAELARRVGCSRSVLQRLMRDGMIRTSEAPSEAATPQPAANLTQRPLSLTAAQEAALEAIERGIESAACRVVALAGVTASGKTEVYIRSIDKVVRAGKQAIVLVPEISLTPQITHRFRDRFAEVAVMHSHLTDSQRNAEWRRIRDGKVQVIIGARSAVFAPAPRLGLIVIDEEHENSFKQESTPRYHAREVALHRARLERIPLVLGSATLSLETYAAARDGRYELVRLPDRVEGRPLPPVEIVDMRAEQALMRHGQTISPRLRAYIGTAIRHGEQVILFLNRRGFSTTVLCRRCGYVMKCRHCDVSLSYHKGRHIGLCPSCGYSQDLPQTCPECHQGGLRYSGVGTERVEEEVIRTFPDARLIRVDSDTMRQRGAHQRVYDEFLAGRAQILLGTQMIAKGLDFPNVTLVGVINADVLLNLPDFRSSERTFQLLTQVAGRSGRGPLGGHVVIQTYAPDSHSVRCASTHDYEGFVRSELEHRRELGYPPFSRLARIVFQGRCEEEVARVAGQSGQVVRPLAGSNLEVLGPAPAPITRIKGEARYHLIIKSFDEKALRQALDAIQGARRKSASVQAVVDVDPTNML